MDKSYNRINWQNQPSTATALGATNLNKMDLALNIIDDRVIAIDTSKASKDEVNLLVKDVTFDESTGQIKITYKNDTFSIIDTAMEKMAVNFVYNNETQKIELTLSDGSIQYIDISDFVTNVDFENSDTITFVEENGKTKAQVIDGSITPEKLQPDYLADITVQAQTTLVNANKAQRYAVGGIEEGDATDNAKYYCEEAEKYAQISKGGDAASLGGHLAEEYQLIANMPTSLPADGGDSNTVGGYEPDDFAFKGELETYKPTNYTGTTEEEINTYYDNLHINSPNAHWYRAIITNNFAHSILNGGARYVEGYRLGEQFGWQTSIGYWNDKKKFIRVMEAGVWKEWENIADGGNASAVDGLHLVTLTQSEYDALTTKDENTIYITI